MHICSLREQPKINGADNRRIAGLKDLAQSSEADSGVLNIAVGGQTS